jgi:hypothetical protein
MSALTPADIIRLRNIAPAPQPAPQAEGDSDAQVARAWLRDRLMEAQSERERFESMGVKYDEVKP